MSLSSLLEEALHRLDGKHLLGEGGSVSVRLPGTQNLLLGVPGKEPTQISLCDDADGAYQRHIEVYRAREDVGAMAWGGGPFGRMLGEFGGVLPQVFDEQARHLGPSFHVGRNIDAVGNVWIHGSHVAVFGSTVHRLVLNAELLEKCAKAYVLAAATGASLHTLPWWVCRIANGRLKKDQRRAKERFSQGLLPEEVKGY